ncbi:MULTISPECIES: hypothetical protein [unclassified Guyparkeria]|uniref:hypothetical protein n=1 Tax=unclassified Guyparkeria TaxID=2626246 RepID=UPI0007333D74|nr:MULTISPECIES: hypothetical protein [unclassified Guyparkeria]KTG17387.1 hypothetical protein AUR63_09590 [Guyparkeria sp. XI15]OAE87364.1 hypothetical protein AWR35_09610 [Guyparkeria sp. WRN-7]
MLDHLAWEIIRGLPEQFSPRHERVVVFCGTHKGFGLNWLRRGYKIALQTEQMYDQTGKPLWGQSKKRARRLAFAARAADLVLDLSASNRRFYEEHCPRALAEGKVRFGPYLFPSHPLPFDPDGDQSVAFFGSVGEGRRSGVIERIDAFPVRMLESGTFFDDLYRQVRACAAVLNVHFEDGVYTEAPRLLTSLYSGKPLVSEPLAAPFVAGEHYIPIEAYGTVDNRAIFERLSRFVSDNLSFERFLRDNRV